MAAALLVVRKVVREQVLQEVSTSLEQKLRTCDSLLRIRLEQLARTALIVAETPYLTAAIETNHPETVQAVLDQHIQSSTDSVLIIFDAEGRLLAYRGARHLQPDQLDIAGFYGSQGLLGAKIDILDMNGIAVQAALAPVISPDPLSGMLLLGQVLVGMPIDTAYLASLEQMIGGQFVFARGHEAVVASAGVETELATAVLQQSQKPVLSSGRTVRTLAAGNGEYVVGRLPARASPEFGFVLFVPYDSIFQAILAPVERTILWISGFTLVIAILISSLISRHVVRPVQKLVSLTDAMSAGDYDQPIENPSHDEIGYLAHKFDTMRQSLQRQMTELGKRNAELEAALAQLEKTQQELVLSEKLAATGKITAQLSHELNNPIHNVRSCLEAATRKVKKGQDPQEYLQLAHDEIVRMGNLVRHMLDFYRPSIVEREAVDVNRLLENVLQTTRERLSQHQVIIVRKLAPDLPPIKAAPDQLKQVFMNLVMNAVDAMPGGGTIEISTQACDGVLWIDFRDSGMGIEPEKLPAIFDAFYTTKAQASGVGLGLSVSYGIIKGHRGKISVESAPGKGSLFRVQLPLS